MQRREFITLLGGAVAGWPLTARAQQPTIPIIGFLNGQSLQSQMHLLPAFKSGLQEAGFVEGQNVAIEYRWADNQNDRLAAMAAELIGKRISVLVASGGDVPAQVAKAATSTIPIVTTMGDDPVKAGLVASINRPGGNITGAILFPFDGLLSAKRIELIRDLAPISNVGLLLNPKVYGELIAKEAEAAATAFGIRLVVAFASNASEIDAAFETLAKQRVDALIVSPDPFFTNQREKLVGLSNRNSLPTSYALREFVQAGGLMSYGSSRADMYRQLGVYAGRILNGAKPGDLPVQAPVKFELVINLKTAKALGLDVPAQLLARADEVIE
jgi:putative tryptophan/tyrosine transport system substrate-binding protein